MIFCFRAQALVCLTPSLRPSSTELMPFLAVATSHMARNQAVSGSLVAWKIVPAVSEAWCRQARHWIFGRVLSHLPSHPVRGAKACGAQAGAERLLTRSGR